MRTVRREARALAFGWQCVIAVSADKEEDNEENNEQDKGTMTIAR